MKRVTFLVVAIVFVMIAATSAFSQVPKRIQLARGAASSVVLGTLNGYNDKRTFVIKLRRGQTLTTESAGDNHITVDIKPPRGARYEADLAADCHDRHRVPRSAPADGSIT